MYTCLGTSNQILNLHIEKGKSDTHLLSLTTFSFRLCVCVCVGWGVGVMCKVSTGLLYNTSVPLLNIVHQETEGDGTDQVTRDYNQTCAQTCAA